MNSFCKGEHRARCPAWDRRLGEQRDICSTTPPPPRSQKSFLKHPLAFCFPHRPRCLTPALPNTGPGADPGPPTASTTSQQEGRFTGLTTTWKISHQQGQHQTLDKRCTTARTQKLFFSSLWSTPGAPARAHMDPPK